jgi:hypothetical protein
VYGTINHDGQIIIYDEDYEAEANIETFARSIKKRGFSHVYADPSVVNRGPNKKSPKQLYQEQDIYLIPASNDEDFFITYLIKLFRDRTSDGRPMIMISKKCKYLIDQIKNAAWDPKTISGSTHDKVKRDENHARDALKYFINGMCFMPGVLNPVVPSGSEKSKALVVNGNWEHESFLEDKDFDTENYCHPEIKEAVLNATYSNTNSRA